MKTNPMHLCLLVIAMLLSSAVAADGAQLKPYRGDLTRPAIELPDMSGQPHSLADYRGNIVLLQFWATYCTPCRTEMPSMNRLLAKLRDKPFKIVAVNMAETPAEVQTFLDQVPVDFPVLLDRDGAALKRWKVFAAPASFILDKQGKIIYTLYGATEWDSKSMLQRLGMLADS